MDVLEHITCASLRFAVETHDHRTQITLKHGVWRGIERYEVAGLAACIDRHEIFNQSNFRDACFFWFTFQRFGHFAFVTVSDPVRMHGFVTALAGFM